MTLLAVSPNEAALINKDFKNEATSPPHKVFGGFRLPHETASSREKDSLNKVASLEDLRGCLTK